MTVTTAAPSAALTSFVAGLALLARVYRPDPPGDRGVHLGPGDGRRGGAPGHRTVGGGAGITALGQMLVIMTGGIDLSVPGR